jgi:hypothetical protein
MTAVENNSVWFGERAREYGERRSGFPSDESLHFTEALILRASEEVIEAGRRHAVLSAGLCRVVNFYLQAR